jgi:hypothetical protein
VTRSAIVTGASSGIGRATAILLARRGFNVGITYNQNAAGAEQVAAILRGEGHVAELTTLDLGDEGSVVAAVNLLTDRLGHLDVMVNNAGTLALQPFLEMEMGVWRGVIDRNLTGAFIAARTAARRMIEGGHRDGAIINVASVHSFVPLREGAAYCASKGGLSMLTKVMALELAPHGIRVNEVCPGEVATPMSGAAQGEDARDRHRPDLPAGRPASVEEVAFVIVSLADPANGYTIGSSVIVDGGMLLTAAIPNQNTIMAGLKKT